MRFQTVGNKAQIRDVCRFVANLVDQCTFTAQDSGKTGHSKNYNHVY